MVNTLFPAGTGVSSITSYVINFWNDFIHQVVSRIPAHHLLFSVYFTFTTLTS